MGMARNSKGKSVSAKYPGGSNNKATGQGGAKQGGAAPAHTQAARETTTPTTTGATSAPKQGPFVGYRAPGTAGKGTTSGPMRPMMPTAPLPPQQRF